MQFLIDNKQWIFDGIGVTVLVGAIWVIRRAWVRRQAGENATQYQKTGAFSKNTQIGSITVTEKERKND